MTRQNKLGSALVLKRVCTYCGKPMVAFRWDCNEVKWCCICNVYYCYQYRQPMHCDIKEETVDKKATEQYVKDKLNQSDMYKKGFNVSAYLQTNSAILI